MAVGKVRWFDPEKGYGFIRPDGTDYDVFVHIKDLRKTGLQQLTQDQRVSFTAVEGQPGKGDKAVDVQVEA